MDDIIQLIKYLFEKVIRTFPKWRFCIFILFEIFFLFRRFYAITAISMHALLRPPPLFLILNDYVKIVHLNSFWNKILISSNSAAVLSWSNISCVWVLEAGNAIINGDMKAWCNLGFAASLDSCRFKKGFIENDHIDFRWLSTETFGNRRRCGRKCIWILRLR